MRTFVTFCAVMASMLIALFSIDLYDSYVNRQTTDTVVSTINADHLRSMKSLCESYRKWQALPEIVNDYTNMDPICTKIESGQP